MRALHVAPALGTRGLLNFDIIDICGQTLPCCVSMGVEGAILCIVGCLAASLTSTYWITITSPSSSCEKQKCFRTLSDIGVGGTKLSQLRITELDNDQDPIKNTLREQNSFQPPCPSTTMVLSCLLYSCLGKSQRFYAGLKGN